MDIPLGFRFCPTAQELVVHFLKRKILSQDLPRDIIIPEVDLYEYGRPEYLLEKFRPQMDYGKEKNWYFLTLLKPKTPCGKRPNRVTGRNEGVWMATGCPIPIMDDDQNITLGHKRSFCYYQKKPKKDETNYQTKPKEGKTNWIMHEFTIDDKINWVLCKIHHHSSGSESSQEAHEGVSDAAPEQFNTDDARYCLSTSQEPITALVPYSYDSQVHSSTNTMIDMEVDGNASYCLSTTQEPIAAMIPYSYDSQAYSSTNTMMDMEYDGNIQSVNNLCSLSAPSIPWVPSNTMINMEFDDGNMQFANNLWSSLLTDPSIPCITSNTMIDMQFDGNIQSVNNLWSTSASAPSLPCMPSNTMIDDGNMQFANNLWSSLLFAPSIACLPSNIMIDMQFDGNNMQSVNNFWSSSSSAASIPCVPSNTKIDVQFDGNVQFVNNLWSSSSTAPSIPTVPSNTMIDVQFDGNINQFVNNLCSSSSSAQSMSCVTSGLSRESDSRFPSFHQDLEYPVATFQSNGTSSGINLLDNAGMFCGLQGPDSMNGSYDHSGTVGF